MDAGAYFAGIGSPDRFCRAAEIWAFAGFDPIADGSGDRPERAGHLSKRGDPAFRNALYQMGYRTAQNYAPVSISFLDAFDRGQSEVEATIHAAHRVNRICFHLIKNNEPFDNRSTPQLEADKGAPLESVQVREEDRDHLRTRRY